MNITKINYGSPSFGRVRHNAAYEAINSYNRRMGKDDISYLKTIKKLALEQATNYRFDVDYNCTRGYEIIDNSTRKPVPVARALTWLDEACAIASFNNEIAEKTEKNNEDNPRNIKREIFNIVG